MWRDCNSSSMTHKSQKRKTRTVDRNESKQPSPNRTRNREWLLLCSLCSQPKCPSIDCIAKPLPNAAQTLEDQHFEEPERQQPFFDFLTQYWHREIHLFARQLEDYSNEAHLSAITAAIQYSETFTDTDEFSPDFEGKDDDSFSLLQNTTKTHII